PVAGDGIHLGNALDVRDCARRSRDVLALRTDQNHTGHHTRPPFREMSGGRAKVRGSSTLPQARQRPVPRPGPMAQRPCGSAGRRGSSAAMTTRQTAPDVAAAVPPVASAHAALLLLVLIWGVNFPVAKAALTELNPLAFNALRFPLAALVVYAALRRRG